MLWAIFDAFEFTRKSTRWINWIAGKYTGREMSCHREPGINFFSLALFANACFLLWLCFWLIVCTSQTSWWSKKLDLEQMNMTVCVCVHVCVCVVSMGRCCHHRCVCHVKNTDGLHLFLSTTPLIILYITNALFTRVHLLQLILFIYLFISSNAPMNRRPSHLQKYYSSQILQYTRTKNSKSSCAQGYMFFSS